MGSSSRLKDRRKSEKPMTRARSAAAWEARRPARGRDSCIRDTPSDRNRSRGLTGRYPGVAAKAEIICSAPRRVKRSRPSTVARRRDGSPTLPARCYTPLGRRAVRPAILFMDTNILLDYPDLKDYRRSLRPLTLVVIPEVMAELRGLSRAPARGEAGAALRALAVLEPLARPFH